jgi:hypothetical protein
MTDNFEDNSSDINASFIYLKEIKMAEMRLRHPKPVKLTKVQQKLLLTEQEKNTLHKMLLQSL